MSDLDIVVEIRGPNTICSERITKKSPKKKRSISSFEYSRPITRSMSCNEEPQGIHPEDKNDLEEILIPLEYEVIGNQISLGYRPKEKGQHQLTILWHGQHVSDSPYSVAVEYATKVVGTSVIPLKSALKSTNETDNNESRKTSVRFQGSQLKYIEENRHFGKVLSKRVLGYIVKINGEDVPVNAVNTESLATELLRMDYDFEKCSSFHRRNSWGFTGDAERKKSVIRQFGVDERELEAQALQRRSRSLSINSERNTPLEKSYSFDNLPSRLKIVEEHAEECAVHDNHNEQKYAFINNDLYVALENAENSDDRSPMLSKREEFKSTNILLERDSDANPLENPRIEADLGRISALSTDFLPGVDNLYEDSPTDLSHGSVNLKTSILIKYETIDDGSSEELSSKSELSRNDAVYNKQDNKPSNYSKPPSDKKMTKIRSKKKKSQNVRKCLCSYLNRKYQTRITGKTKEQFFYTKASKSSHFLQNQFEDKNESMPELKTISANTDNPKNDDLFESTNLEKHKMYTQYSNKNINIPLIKSECDTTTSQSNNLNHDTEISDAEHARKGKTAEINHSFINIAKSSEKVRTSVMSKSAENLLKDKKSFPNNSTKPTQISLTQSEVKARDINADQSKPLKTHTLKTLMQFDFKQFNPTTDVQDAVSPVKRQIKQWERSLSSEKPDVPLKVTSTTEISDVSVKEKLAFWESTTKAGENSPKQKSPESNRKINNEKCIYSSQSNLNAAMNDLQGPGDKSISSLQNERMPTETNISVNQETNKINIKQTDIKISAVLQPVPRSSSKRSFSDPGILDTTNETVDNYSYSSNVESFNSKDYLCSSNDDNLESYHWEEEYEESGSDYILQSSEDEYIDDEIPESALEYWGDLGVLKDLKLTQCLEDYSFLEQEFQCQGAESYPEECKVFGIAAYYGRVATKNRFQIYTGDAGYGSISVNVQGFRQHEVTLISIAYVRNYFYEVTYQVMTAGYYLISIRWLDKPIPGSPFICKVTF